MNVIQYAYKVDAIIGARSKLSVIQKAVADQLIADHHRAGSTVEECAAIVRSNLIELSR